MLMDISSEMVHSLLPLFMVSALGASAFMVGLVEGLGEATALIVKVFSGVLSDYVGRRKQTTGMVLAARLLDRVGKGVRGAPRDALVADIAPPHLRGAAFVRRQSLDTVAAFVARHAAKCSECRTTNATSRTLRRAIPARRF